MSTSLCTCAVGPALGGALTAAFGITAPFWINAVSNLGINGGLVWWHSPRRGGSHLPAERFGRAIRTGLRHARHNRYLRATLLRAVGFFLFASAYWALLPLVARSQIAAGPEIYGILLGGIGAGAVGAAFGLPWAKRQLGADRLAQVNYRPGECSIALPGTQNLAAMTRQNWLGGLGLCFGPLRPRRGLEQLWQSHPKRASDLLDHDKGWIGSPVFDEADRILLDADLRGEPVLDSNPWPCAIVGHSVQAQQSAGHYSNLAGSENGLVASTTNIMRAVNSVVPLLKTSIVIPAECPFIECPASTFITPCGVRWPKVPATT